MAQIPLPVDSRLPLMLSVVGVLSIGVGGWLGGEMVYVKGMAVEAVDELAKKVEKSSRGPCGLKSAELHHEHALPQPRQWSPPPEALPFQDAFRQQFLTEIRTGLVTRRFW